MRNLSWVVPQARVEFYSPNVGSSVPLTRVSWQSFRVHEHHDREAVGANRSTSSNVLASFIRRVRFSRPSVEMLIVSQMGYEGRIAVGLLRNSWL